MNKFIQNIGASLLGMGALVATSITTASEAGYMISSNIAATSNYLWRGATQTDDHAAVQGGIDYTHDSGIYLGTWASNVDFGSGAGSSGEVEWDVYGGYAGKIDEFGYDAGVIGYLYPDTRNANFYELALSGSYSIVGAGVNYTFASDVTDTGNEVFVDGDLYYFGSLGFDLDAGYSTAMTLGSYFFSNDSSINALNYVHYQLDITKSDDKAGDFTFSLSKADREANGGDDD